MLDEHHLPREYVEFLEERAVPLLRTAIEEFFGSQPSRRSLVGKTSRTILHLAEMGHAILVGRGGGILTRTLPGGVRIRLIGSPDHRIHRVQEYYKLTEDEAWVFMRKTDADRATYIKTYFKKDIEDPLLYDFVVNTDHAGPAMAARLVAEALARPRNPIP